MKNWKSGLERHCTPQSESTFFYSLWGVYMKGEFSVLCAAEVLPVSPSLLLRAEVWGGKTLVGAITYIDLLTL